MMMATRLRSNATCWSAGTTTAPRNPAPERGSLRARVPGRRPHVSLANPSPVEAVSLWSLGPGRLGQFESRRIGAAPLKAPPPRGIVERADRPANAACWRVGLSQASRRGLVVEVIPHVGRWRGRATSKKT